MTEPPMPTPEPTATSTAEPTSTPEAAAAAVREVPAAERYVHENLATGDVGTDEYPLSPPGQTDVLERVSRCSSSHTACNQRFQDHQGPE